MVKRRAICNQFPWQNIHLTFKCQKNDDHKPREESFRAINLSRILNMEITQSNEVQRKYVEVFLID